MMIGPSATTSSAVGAELDALPVQARKTERRPGFAQPRSERAPTPHEQMESTAAELDELDRFVSESRAETSGRRPGNSRARAYSAPANTRAARRQHDRQDIEREGGNPEDDDHLQTRKLQAMAGGGTGSSDSDDSGRGQHHSGARQICLYAPSTARTGADLRAAHPVRLALARIEAHCNAAHASDAPREYFVRLIDASLRDTLLLTAQAVVAGAAAGPLLGEVINRLGMLYARHARGLESPLGLVAGELTQAFGEWRAPGESLPRMGAFFIAVPCAYMAIRSGTRHAEAAT
ncbi:MAG: hypothetical protein KA795_03390 [Burkholderiaceae bacterium]|nr:hypothetical protein [Burkholderiaceae bacterium]